MAFAISNIRHGTIGDLKLMAGDWTGSAGDDNGTLTFERGRSYFADFNTQDNNGPSQEIPVFAASSTATTTTFSIANRKTVTVGRFLTIRA